MKISQQETDLFFELTWALHFFVNQKLNVLPPSKTLEEYIALPMEEKFKVREALFKNIQLVDSFVVENPQNFSEEKLLIVSKWKEFVKGDFYIERFLKQHAIFISKTDRVYGVCGLHKGFNEMIHSSHLPLLIQTVLLPFAGKIVYDGLFQTYNIHFGSGIRGNLKEIYMIAKQNNRIVETLDSTSQSKESKVQVLKNWEPEIKKLYEQAKLLKGGTRYPLNYNPAFGLVKTSLEFALEVVSSPSDLDAMYKVLKKVERELKKAYTVIEREDK